MRRAAGLRRSAPDVRPGWRCPSSTSGERGHGESRHRRRKPEVRSDPPSGFSFLEAVMSEAATKETKAQRAERLKQALNPWEAYAEIQRFAREGIASIPPEWGMYFRWWGFYSQGDGVGAVGGKGGEGK